MVVLVVELYLPFWFHISFPSVFIAERMLRGSLDLFVHTTQRNYSFYSIYHTLPHFQLCPTSYRESPAVVSGLNSPFSCAIYTLEMYTVTSSNSTVGYQISLWKNDT